ncbi:hypothetical protein [Pseudomonas sp. PS01303]|uniref:DUF6945 domain-containing protein n=1 Tax=Pseudomonas sp. PS01303 TaxID=2991439 RepID=UPI00249A7ECB|nr:hypothetical protein [Pseudomonas sp. PS01303]
MTEEFCKIPKEMMRATHWVSKTTGQQFKFTGTQKIIWVYMVDRYKFFKSLGNDWFDDQEDIAKNTGCDVSTVKGFIKQLLEHGYMVVERKKLRGFVSSNSYEIIASLQLHNKHASASVPVQSSSDVKVLGSEVIALEGGGAVIASQEVAVQPLPVFENVPLEAYIDKPPKAPVVVLEALQGFADTLDAEIDYDVPVLPKGLADSSNEPDLWGGESGGVSM